MRSRFDASTFSADAFTRSTTAAAAACSPRATATALAPDVTALNEARKSASARTVEVVVPSPASSLVFLAAAQFDFLGDGRAVLGDRGGAPALLDDDGAAAGPEGGPDGVGDLLHAAADRLACFDVEQDLLGHVRPP
jgi:hypothetical protein